MAEIIPAGVHRPRNVDWQRAAALLYGDWGTSKAYVLGLAFVAAGFASFPIILAVCALTAVVAFNYIIICAHFPDGGGVYSAARQQSRFLASVGALFADREFPRYCCPEWMGRRNVSRRPDFICAVRSDGSDPGASEPSITLVQSTAAASRFGWLFPP